MLNKETATLNASVGADAGQPPVKYNTMIVSETSTQSNPTDAEMDALLREMEEINSDGYIHTVSHNDLLNTSYAEKQSIIDDLLYTGAYILAGAPKIGKSFLVAQISHHVSTGEPLWGYRVRQCDVLYLALEDDEHRLQSRMYRMYGIEGTDHLRFATSAKQVGSGLNTQLEYALNRYPKTRLVIVDTLQKVREISGDNYSYANDYQVIGALKEFADTHHICILIVHHTRKQPAGDTFEMISGTTGLLGCADGALLMQKEKRTSVNATLDIVGRDQPEQRLFLIKNLESLIWELDRAENELWKEPPDSLLIAINELLSESLTEWQGSATELSKALQIEMQANALTKRLNVRAGKLLNEYGIQYQNSHSRSGSRITLRRISSEM